MTRKNAEGAEQTSIDSNQPPLWGRAMAQAVSRRPPIAEARVRSRVIHVGFVVDKVALGQVFPRVLRFSPVNFIPPMLNY
jgi:hypothetical protein